MKKLLFLILSAFVFGFSFGQNCDNADFENGNFAGWSGGWGVNGNPAYYSGFNNGNHTLVTSGYDPFVGGTILPQVYGSGTTSLRLGNSNVGAEAELISRTFTVDASTAAILYHFAAVVEAPGHAPADQPYFTIKMFDGNNVPIPYADFEVSESAFSSLTGFVNTGSLIYNTWQTHIIPLNDYLGQDVRLEFITADCSTAGHFGYAYLDVECIDMEITSSSPALCAGETVTLTAPAGAASYSWSGLGIIGATDIQTTSVNTSGTYTVTMTTYGSSPLTFSTSLTLSDNPTPTSLFNLYPDVEPLHYIAENHATGTAPLDYVWDWGDGNFDNIAYPSHTYDVSGNYTICLTITDANGCTDNYCNDYTFKTESPIAYINVVDPLTVGITENRTKPSGLTIYPNPTTNTLTIETQTAKGTYHLQDITGKLLLSGLASGETKFSIDISALSKGIYLLSLIDGEQQVNRKVVKE